MQKQKQKLLLIEDVFDLGRSGEVVSVKPGYARNFLIPQKKAVVADKQTLKMQERLKKERSARAVKDKKESKELAQQLETITISTSVKVDPEGKMYGSVSVNDIIHLLEKEGVKIEKRSIVLKHPVKEIGVTEIPLKLKEGIESKVVLKITAESSEKIEK
jgi:large subunit ribosomal protein L9